MSKNLFITATGTDIGKTFISALIVKTMRENGFDCGYFKPVLSGGKCNGGKCNGGKYNGDKKLIESDANYVIEMAEIPASANECVTYWWEEAVSPHLAAERAGDTIETSVIKKHFEQLSSKYEYLLIEGAGGITCPLRLTNGEHYLLKDLIKELEAPILIVADAGLGTINSVLLTVEYAKTNNIPIAGIVLNNYEPENFMHKDNYQQIEYLTGIKIFATVEKNQKEIQLLQNLFV